MRINTLMSFLSFLGESQRERIGRGEGICRFPAVPLDFQVK